MTGQRQMLNTPESISIAEEMRRDKSVVVWGENVTFRRVSGEMLGLPEEFGRDRVQDMPMVESALVEMATGVAFTGLRPIVQMFGPGILLCAFAGVFLGMGTIRQEFGWRGPLPIVIYFRNALGSGSSGPDHSLGVESLLMNSPGLKVVYPSTAYDAKGLMKAAIRDNDPVVFIGHAALYNSKREAIPREEYVIPLGRADVKREGSDVTVVAYGGMIPKALTAAKTLSKEGISIEVIDLRTLVPLDIKTIVKSVKKTGRLVITHEAMERGGAAGEIAFRVTEALPNPMKTMKAPIRRLAGKNVGASRDGAELQQAFLPQVKDIVELVKEMV